MKNKRIIRALLLAVVMMGVIAVPSIIADEPDPDVLIIDSVEVYRHVILPDDQLWLVPFNCDYTTNITDHDISEAFIFRLMDSTPAIVDTTTAYPYYDDGYDNGIIAFYYNPDDALTWEGNYTIYLEGNPTLTWASGDPPLVSSNVTSWFDEGSVADAQDRLTTRMRYIAGQLEAEWVLDLIETSISGTVLTGYGEDYFLNTIPNLRDMCPDLFYQSMVAAEYEHDILVTDMLSVGADDDEWVYDDHWYAQTFQPSEGYDIAGVNLPLNRVGAPGELTVSLRATAVGVPTGADLVSGAYDADTLTTDTDGEWIELAFTSDYTLTSGATYAIIVRATAGDIANYVGWLVDIDAGYANGQQCTSTDSGATWAGVAGEDMLFEIIARGGRTIGIGSRVEGRLAGTQFDFSNFATSLGLSNIWWSTVFWFIISLVLMVAIAFASNSWDIIMVVFAFMMAYGWRGGWVDTIVFAIALALLSGGMIYGLFWRQT